MNTYTKIFPWVIVVVIFILLGAAIAILLPDSGPTYTGQITKIWSESEYYLISSNEEILYKVTKDTFDEIEIGDSIESTLHRVPEYPHIPTSSGPTVKNKYVETKYNALDQAGYTYSLTHQEFMNLYSDLMEQDYVNVHAFKVGDDIEVTKENIPLHLKGIQ